MAKVRVPLWGKANGYVAIDTEATKGAVVGESLYNPDGTLYQPESSTPSTSDGRTLWSLIQSIPALVSSLAVLATDGFVRKSGSALSASAIVTADLPDLADAGAGTALKKIARDAKGRVAATEDGTAADVPYDNSGSGLAAEDVQAAIDELAVEKVDDAPSDGKTYGRKDGAWSVAGGGGGGGAMSLLGSETIAGSSATSISVSGLDLSAFRSFVVDFALGNASGSSATLSLFFNGDTTATNYNRQVLFSGGASTSSSRGNDAGISAIPANETVTGSFRVQIAADGEPRAYGQLTTNSPSSIEARMFSLVRGVSSNVTSIELSSSVADSITVGSTMAVYGIV